MDPLGWILPSGGGRPYWDPLINSPGDFSIRGKSGERYLGQTGMDIDPETGMAIYYNDNGTFSPRTLSLEQVNVRRSRIFPSMGMKVLDVSTDFLPVVGSSKDVYKGIRDGNFLQFGLGVGGLIFDIASLGTGSLLKGGLKAGVKGLAEVGTREVVEQAAKGGMTDLQLLTRTAQKAETAIVGTGRFAGTAKHTYANNLLSRYQSI